MVICFESCSLVYLYLIPFIPNAFQAALPWLPWIDMGRVDWLAEWDAHALKEMRRDCMIKDANFGLIFFFCQIITASNFVYYGIWNYYLLIIKMNNLNFLKANIIKDNRHFVSINFTDQLFQITNAPFQTRWEILSEIVQSSFQKYGPSFWHS